MKKLLLGVLIGSYFHKEIEDIVKKGREAAADINDQAKANAA